ncbi:MAG: YciK family oxidoreductase [Gammaproteobacteria bacterium]
MPIPRLAPNALAERVVLLTGANGGIGRPLALAAARLGAHVVLLGRNQKKLERVYDEIEQQGYPRPALLPFDLETTDPSAYKAVARTLEDEFGRLDGLVHCAATLGTLTPIEHYDLGTWQRVLTVNLTSAFLLTRACLPLLKQSKDAAVVFSSADVGRRGRAYWGAYGVAAFGVEGMAQVLADEVASNTAIRVYTLDPGPTRSTLRTQAYPAENPVSVPPPEDVVDAYLYLLSPDSRAYAGQALTARALLADV